MSNNIENKIIARLPYLPSFLFVNEISLINDDEIIGHYTFGKDNFFYNAHFKHIPITPGIVLIEMMGQIGLVAHLVYLHKLYDNDILFHPILSYVESSFYKKVEVNDKLTIKSKKIYYRNNILKSKIELFDSSNDLCATLIAQLQLVFD